MFFDSLDIIWVPPLLWTILHAADYSWAVEIAVGAIVFTRVAVISHHLSNIWLFLHLRKNPAAVSGSVSWGRRTLLWLSAARYAGASLLVSAAALFVPSFFLFGGSLGLWGVMLVHFRWARDVQDEARRSAS